MAKVEEIDGETFLSNLQTTPTLKSQVKEKAEPIYDGCINIEIGVKGSKLGNYEDEPHRDGDILQYFGKKRPIELEDSALCDEYRNDNREQERCSKKTNVKLEETFDYNLDSELIIKSEKEEKEVEPTNIESLQIQMEDESRIENGNNALKSETQVKNEDINDYQITHELILKTEIEENAKSHKNEHMSRYCNGEPSAPIKNDRMTPARKRLECTYCSYNTLIQKSLNSHVRNRHHNIATREMFQCGHCKFQTTSRDAFNAHANAKHVVRKTVQCAHCSYSTRFKRSLNYHMRTNHNNSQET